MNQNELSWDEYGLLRWNEWMVLQFHTQDGQFSYEAALAHHNLDSLAVLHSNLFEAKWRAGHLLAHATIHDHVSCPSCQTWTTIVGAPVRR